MNSSNRLRLAVIAALSSGSAMAGDVTFDGTVGAAGAAPFDAASRTFTVGQDRGTLAGTNLFHSFSTFIVDGGETARFTATTPGITNVISRVTGIGSPNGLQPTIINGTVRSEIPDANFWFVNPAGITVGPDGVIDVPGALALGAADLVGGWDARGGNQGSPISTLTADPGDFGFFENSTAGAVTVRSTDLLNQTSIAARRIGHGFRTIAFEIIDADGRIRSVGIEERPPVSRLYVGRAGVTLDSPLNIDLRDVRIDTGELDFDGSGNISITAAGTLSIQDAYFDTEASGGGPIGNISLQGDQIDVANTIFLTVSDGVSGRSSGNITVSAIGGDVNGTAALSMADSFVYAGSQGSFGGSSGTIDLAAPLGTVALTDNTMSTYAGAAATASGAMNISGSSVDLSGGIFSSLTLAPSSDAGPISVTATGADLPTRPALRVRDGALISTSTLSDEEDVQGDGGRITLSANQGTLQISGARTAVSGASGTQFSGPAEANRTGNAGSMTLNARDIEISNGALITTSVHSTTFTSPDDPKTLAIDAQREVRVLSGARIESLSTAPDAEIIVDFPIEHGRTANSIHIGGSSILIDNSTVTASTIGSGNAGSIEIVGGLIRINNLSSLLTTTADQGTGNAGNGGNAGNIQITGGQVHITSGSGLAASTDTSGAAGNIGITGSEIHIDDSSVATATTNGGAAGNIAVRSPGLATITHSLLLTGSTDSDFASGDIDIIASGVLIGDQSLVSADYNQAGGHPGGAGAIRIRATGQSTETDPQLTTTAATSGVVRIVDSGVTSTNVGGQEGDQNGRGRITVGADLSVGTPPAGDDGKTDSVVIVGSLLSTSVTAGGRSDDILINGNRGAWILDSTTGYRPTEPEAQADDPRTDKTRSLIASITNQSAVSGGVITIQGGDQGLTIRRSDVDTTNDLDDPGIARFVSNVALSSPGTITLDSAAITTDTTGVNNAGAIQLSGNTIHMSGGQISAATRVARTVGNELPVLGNAGDITIAALGSGTALLVDQGAVIRSDASAAQSTFDAAGLPIAVPNSGAIIVSAPNGTARIEGGSALRTLAGPQAGAAGLISVSANAIELDGASLQASSQGIGDAGSIAALASGEAGLRIGGASTLSSDASTAHAVGSGASLRLPDAGRITVRSEQGGIDISGGSQLVSSAGVLAGQAGTVELDAARGLTLNDVTINTSVETARTVGEGGTPLNSAQISLRSGDAISLTGAQLESETFGAVDAGNIGLSGNGVTISGGTITASTRLNEDSTVGVANTGTAGTVTIDSSDTVQLSGGAVVETSSEAQGGRAGVIVVSGTATLIEDSSVASRTTGAGDAGAICVAGGTSACLPAPAQIAAARAPVPGLGGVTIANSTLTTATSGSGAAGDVSVLAAGQLTLSGATLQSTSESVLANAGRGGSINLSSGLAEDLSIESSIVQTNTAAADAGTITIDANGSPLSLRDARIIASAGGDGNGANVIIDDAAQTIMQRTVILAQAVNGDGGNITINLQPDAILVRDSESAINASSDAGNDGEIEINAPDTDLNSAIKPQDVDNSAPPELSASACTRPEGRSTFVREGKGGVAEGLDSYQTIAAAEGQQPVAATESALGSHEVTAQLQPDVRPAALSAKECL